ncbi:MAG: hypothetical protein ABW185_14705 [Sedimenticola sp.]
MTPLILGAVGNSLGACPIIGTVAREALLEPGAGDDNGEKRSTSSPTY